MSTRTRRDDLNLYTRANDAIVMLGQIIDALERVPGCHTACQRMIVRCKSEQQRMLIKLDKYAAKLGAPYPQ